MVFQQYMPHNNLKEWRHNMASTLLGEPSAAKSAAPLIYNVRAQKSMKLFLATLLLLCISVLHADELVYEIYAINDGSKLLLDKGVKKYSYKDINVSEYLTITTAGRWQKSLDVTNTFNIGGSIYREKEVTGFGLWIGITSEWYEFWINDGFSWEWFTKDNDKLFVKLQESGKLKVTMENIDDNEETRKIEFLSDVTMRLNNSWIPFSTENTHIMVVKQGSILNFEP